MPEIIAIFAQIYFTMGLLSILLLGVGLSLDTFAVSLTLGCFSERITSRQRIRFLVTIGMFHFLMILAGWTFGESISGLIADYDHWIAFVLLGFVGGKMIQEGCSPAKESAPTSDLLSLRNTLLLGLALSIDALISGFSLGLIKVALLSGSQFKNILISALLIGITAALISAIGLRIGRFASSRLGPKAEIFGGIILIGIGVKIVIDHLS